MNYDRTWPVPMISYLEDVSSARANGPRQWSFCVLMPISAPKPNSPPSVKRVEAFQYTAAESISRRNLRAFASSAVMMESECFVEYLLIWPMASSTSATTAIAMQRRRYSSYHSCSDDGATASPAA